MNSLCEILPLVLYEKREGVSRKVEGMEEENYLLVCETLQLEIKLASMSSRCLKKEDNFERFSCVIV